MLAACLQKQYQHQQQLSTTTSLINLLLPATHHLWDTLFSVKESTVEYFCALNHICCCCCEIQTISLSSLLLKNPENSVSVTKKKKRRAISFVQLHPCVCCLLLQWYHTLWGWFFAGLGYPKKKVGRTQRRAIGRKSASNRRSVFLFLRLGMWRKRRRRKKLTAASQSSAWNPVPKMIAMLKSSASPCFCCQPRGSGGWSGTQFGPFCNKPASLLSPRKHQISRLHLRLQEGGSCWRRRKLVKRTKDRFETFKITPCSSSHQHISSSRSSSTSLSLSLSISLDSVRFKTTTIKDLSYLKTHNPQNLQDRRFGMDPPSLFDCFASDHPEQKALAVDVGRIGDDFAASFFLVSNVLQNLVVC